MRHLLLFLSISLAVLIFVCSEQEKSRNGLLQKIELKNVESFYYVALFHRGPYDEQQKVTDKFYQQVASQNLPVEGPLMGLYFNDPETVAPEQLEWAIGQVIADSVTVNKPLMTLKWNVPQVMVCQYSGLPENSAPVYHAFDTFMTRNHLAPAGPSVERFVDLKSGSPFPRDTVRMEIWFAVQSITEE